MSNRYSNIPPNPNHTFPSTFIHSLISLHIPPFFLYPTKHSSHLHSNTWSVKVVQIPRHKLSWFRTSLGLPGCNSLIHQRCSVDRLWRDRRLFFLCLEVRRGFYWLWGWGWGGLGWLLWIAFCILKEGILLIGEVFVVLWMNFGCFLVVFGWDLVASVWFDRLITVLNRTEAILVGVVWLRRDCRLTDWLTDRDVEDIPNSISSNCIHPTILLRPKFSICYVYFLLRPPCGSASPFRICQRGVERTPVILTWPQKELGATGTKTSFPFCR